MRYWGANYSPGQMMQMVHVDSFENRYGIEKDYASQVLALVVVEKDPDQLIKKIASLFSTVAKSVTIGCALDHLVWLGRCKGDSLGLNYQRDGLDCLTYHLGATQCEQGIATLQAVLQRFKDEELKAMESPRQK